ncbi:MAG: hypothetical protein HZB55_12865 [Deltaproteobacteria bacterium]|nr:hypothetical protein [Deltaproteobacteria bacterium]
MKKVTAVMLGMSLIFAGSAFAKPTFVPGAKCKACHEGTPSEKKFTEKAAEMLKKYKTEECKNCHGKAEGDKDITVTKK